MPANKQRERMPFPLHHYVLLLYLSMREEREHRRVPNNSPILKLFFLFLVETKGKRVMRRMKPLVLMKHGQTVLRVAERWVLTKSSGTPGVSSSSTLPPPIHTLNQLMQSEPQAVRIHRELIKAISEGNAEDASDCAGMLARLVVRCRSKSAPPNKEVGTSATVVSAKSDLPPPPTFDTLDAVTSKTAEHISLSDDAAGAAGDAALSVDDQQTRALFELGTSFLDSIIVDVGFVDKFPSEDQQKEHQERLAEGGRDLLEMCLRSFKDQFDVQRYAIARVVREEIIETLWENEKLRQHFVEIGHRLETKGPTKQEKTAAAPGGEGAQPTPNIAVEVDPVLRNEVPNALSLLKDVKGRETMMALTERGRRRTRPLSQVEARKVSLETVFAERVYLLPSGSNDADSDFTLNEELLQTELEELKLRALAKGEEWTESMSVTARAILVEDARGRAPEAGIARMKYAVGLEPHWISDMAPRAVLQKMNLTAEELAKCDARISEGIIGRIRGIDTEVRAAAVVERFRNSRRGASLPNEIEPIEVEADLATLVQPIFPFGYIMRIAVRRRDL